MKTNIADCEVSLLQSKDRVGTTEMADGQMSGNATLQKLVDKFFRINKSVSTSFWHN